MRKKLGVIAIENFTLLVVLSATYHATAQDATTPYPKMAPMRTSSYADVVE